MAAFPVITRESPVEITTASSSLSYQQLVQSLNFIVYYIHTVQMQASSYQQLTVPIKYQELNQFGVVETVPTKANIDPYQSQASLIVGINNDWRLDNLTTLAFDMLPESSLQIEFFGDSFSPSYLLIEKRETKEGEIEGVDSQVEVECKNDIIPLLYTLAFLAGMVLSMKEIFKHDK